MAAVATRSCESFAPFRAAVVVESCAIGGTGQLCRLNKTQRQHLGETVKP